MACLEHNWPHEKDDCPCCNARDVEALRRTAAVLSGAELIQRERHRQQRNEGWTSAHDDTHERGELARAAACYALTGLKLTAKPRWPWAWSDWKPRTRVRDLVRAGALIAAEIDRLQRARPTPQETEP